jgi:hypothetical protein
MTPSLLNITPELTASVAAKTVAAQALLAEIAGDWSPATFANSLGAEDMVLTDLIARFNASSPANPIEIFSLDTGRLPLETYDLMAAVDQHYGLKLKVYFPQSEGVEKLRAGPRHQRFLRVDRIAQSLLLHAQGRTAAACPGWQARLDHRPARPAGNHAQRFANARIRCRQQAGKIQSAGRLVRKGSLDLHQAKWGAVQCLARQVLPQHRLRALHSGHFAG